MDTIVFIHRTGGTKTTFGREQAERVSGKFPGAYVFALLPRPSDGYSLSPGWADGLPDDIVSLARMEG